MWCVATGVSHRAERTGVAPAEHGAGGSTGGRWSRQVPGQHLAAPPVSGDARVTRSLCSDSKNRSRDRRKARDT